MSALHAISTVDHLMPAIFLTEADVLELMDIETSIEVVEEAFGRISEEQAMNVPRQRAVAPGVVLHTMSAAAEYLGLVGFKSYTTTKQGARFHVAVYDSTSGEMLAMIEANYLGQLRTGAASGVATQYMARPDAKIVGLFGTGLQARTQLKAVCAVRRIERVEVYGRDADRRREFADEMTEYCATKVVPAHAPDAAAAEKDIVITATTAKSPVFDGRVLDEGTHLNVVGSNWLGKAEIDVVTIRRADHIVCDSIEACRIEAGDFTRALDDGVTDWRLMHDLGDVVTGRQTGRATPENITLFKSVGLGIEDVAMAGKIIERAREAGLGSPLPF
jgi:alanine dehydrogenase